MREPGSEPPLSLPGPGQAVPSQDRARSGLLGANSQARAAQQANAADRAPVPGCARHGARQQIASRSAAGVVARCPCQPRGARVEPVGACSLPRPGARGPQVPAARIRSQRGVVVLG